MSMLGVRTNPMCRSLFHTENVILQMLVCVGLRQQIATVLTTTQKQSICGFFPPSSALICQKSQYLFSVPLHTYYVFACAWYLKSDDGIQSVNQMVSGIPSSEVSEREATRNVYEQYVKVKLVTVQKHFERYSTKGNTLRYCTGKH